MSKVTRHTTKTLPSIDDIIEAIKKDMVKSNCPEGCLRIENFYWNPETNEIVIQTEDE